MAAITEKLRYLIEADAKGAVRDIEKFGDAADKQMTRAQSAADKWGSRLTAGGAAAVGFAAVTGAALTSFAKKSEEAERQSVRLDSTLSSQPQLANANKQAFLDLATSLQKVTAADDDAIIGAEALLGQFGLTQDQILDLTPLVVDLSRKMGVDLETAAKAVGKSVNGTTAGLQRMGILVDQDAAKTDAFTATQDALSKAVGGFAEKEGKTFSGRLTILKHQLEEVEEGIGSGVVDAVSNALGPLTALSEKFSGLDEDTQHAIGTTATYVTAAVGLAGAISIAAGQVLKFRTNLGRLAGPTAKGLAGVTALVVGYEVLNTVLSESDRKMQELADSFVAGGEDAAKLESKIRDLGDNTDIDGLVGKFRDYRDALLAGEDATLDLEAAQNAAAKSGDQIATTALTQLRAYRDEIEKIIEEHGEFAATSATASAAQRRFADLLATGTASARELNQARRDVVETARAEERVQKQVNAAVDEGSEAVRGNTEETEKNNRTLEERIDDLLAATGSQVAFMQSINDTREQLSEYNTDLLEGKKPLQELTAEELALKQQLIEVGNQALETAEQQKGGALSAKEKVDILRNTWALFGQEIKPGSSLYTFILQTTAELDRMAQPRTATFTVRTEGVVPGTNVPLTVRDSGGPVSAGHPYLIGVNRKPEIFVPDHSGTVYPINRTANGASLSGAPAGMTISIGNVTLPNVRDADDFVNELVAWTRRNGPLPVKVA